MDRLIKTLPAILKASGAAPEVAEAACIAAWRHAVGQGLSDHAAAVQLQNQTLVVVVADDIWKRQLEQMRGQLLFKLNSVLGQPLVKFIELRVEPKKINAAQSAPGTRGIQRILPDTANTSRQIPSELLTAAAGIEDAQLRRAFLGAATSCVNRLENSGD